MRRTKIVATVGPASQDPEMLFRLVRAGVDVFRLNYSHSDHETHAETVRAVREASRRAGREVGVLQDLAGPKIRTGDVAGDERVPLEPGETVVLKAGPGTMRKGVLTTNRPDLARELAPGHRVLLSDGRMELVVEKRVPEGWSLRVVRGGQLAGRQGINLPATRLSAPSLTPEDEDDLRHGLAAGADVTAVSFVRRPADLDAPRRVASAAGRDVFLVAKIEKPEAVENLESILDRADGVMVARGDLGVELPAEEVPLLQKRIIKAANERRIPVITATQMLESMIESPVPTRAEASDVANAILDGTDAVMLSGETALGGYPVEAVETIVRIAEKVELPAPLRTQRRREDPVMQPPEAVARAASRAAEDVGARAIVVYTESGRTARLLSSARPTAPILALSPHLLTIRRLLLSFGVQPHLMPQVERLREMLAVGERIVVEAGQVRPGDRVVVVSGSRAAHAGGTNMMKIHTVGEDPS